MSSLPDCGLPVWEVAAFVAHLPPESATVRAVAPEAAHTHTDEMLRSVDQAVRWLVWVQTKDRQYGRNYPEPYRFPWEDVPAVAGGYRGDSMTTDEAAEFLGWKLHAV